MTQKVRRAKVEPQVGATEAKADRGRDGAIEDNGQTVKVGPGEARKAEDQGKEVQGEAIETMEQGKVKRMREPGGA